MAPARKGASIARGDERAASDGAGEGRSGNRFRARLISLTAGARRLGGSLEDRLDREREQLPLWLPVALATGIGAWFVLPDPAAWAGFLLLAGGGLLLALGAGRERRAGRAAAWFCGAALVGCALIWWRAEAVSAPRLERPQAATFAARIVRADRLAAREQVRLLLAPTDSPGLPPQVRVSVPIDHASPALEPGARVRLRAYLMPPPPMALPGAYDFARTAWFSGIGATGRALGPVEVVAPPDAGDAAQWLASARRNLSALVQDRLPGGEGAIAAALATGDQGGIALEDAEAMRRSGLAHLLSISGLHVTAVVAAVMLLALKLLALSPALALRFNLVLVAAAAGALAGIGYTLLTGSEVPTIRSCVAALLVLGGIALGREAITLRLVATGALVVLLLWPEAAAGPSFQLSFAAVTAIVALHEHPRMRAFAGPQEEGWVRRRIRGLAALAITGLAVELAIAPIALFHFHQAGLYGAFANIVAIPLTTFVVMPAEALALLFDLAGLGAPFWWVAGKALALLLWIAHTTAAAPGAVALVAASPVSAYALLVGGLLWIALWRTGWRWWGAAPFAVGLLAMVTAPAPELLVTGDGRHVAIRSDAGFALLRPRAGDYVRDLLAELAGTDEELSEWDAQAGAACSDALCVGEVEGSGRRWVILATRSRDTVRWQDMVAACAQADIVVSDRTLPKACRPRWLKADRAFLALHGGLAVVFHPAPHITTVREQVGRHPWAI